MRTFPSNESYNVYAMLKTAQWIISRTITLCEYYLYSSTNSQKKYFLKNVLFQKKIKIWSASKIAFFSILSI